jgi:hypothetical protein
LLVVFAAVLNAELSALGRNEKGSLTIE